MPEDLAQGLRTTAAHRTLVLDDRNSTAILNDGPLGRGVTAVELERQELEQGSRLEISHDGYVRRPGFIHRHWLLMGSDGRAITGEELTLPSGRCTRTTEP